MSRTGAVLLVLLAALVHLLACAHGPTYSAAGRADSLLAVSTSCAHQMEPPQQTALQTAPADGDTPQCWGSDEPPVPAPRDIALTVEAAQDALPSEDSGARLTPVPRAAYALLEDPGPSSDGQSRAWLGVWRT
ncbi:hypothetical protein ABZ302_39025 [Streptomyces sp. NPDC006237]|uniref:hypothetical protein n=1 Tax=Streptomyces sp. NPDC006237 TaxID=3154474 RepID=UPI0033B8EBAE